MWFDTTSPPTGAANEHERIKGLLSQLLTESNFLYAITLRYPTTAIDKDIVHWMIKKVLPSQQELNEFYKTLGY